MENNAAAHYLVNDEGFARFLDAVKAAHAIDAQVYGVREGRHVWSPAPKKAARKVRHVIVNADGSETEFSGVKR